jgi:hypothetical protein
LDRPDALVGVGGRHRSTADLDQEALTRFFLPCLFRLLLVRLEDAQPAPLGLSVQTGHGPAQGQGFVLVKAEALGDDRCPQGQHRRSVDGDGFRRQVHGVLAVERGETSRLKLVPPRRWLRVQVAFKGLAIRS